MLRSCAARALLRARISLPTRLCFRHGLFKRGLSVEVSSADETADVTTVMEEVDPVDTGEWAASSESATVVEAETDEVASLVDGEEDVEEEEEETEEEDDETLREMLREDFGKRMSRVELDKLVANYRVLEKDWKELEKKHPPTVTDEQMEAKELDHFDYLKKSRRVVLDDKAIFDIQAKNQRGHGLRAARSSPDIVKKHLEMLPNPEDVVNIKIVDNVKDPYREKERPEEEYFDHRWSPYSPDDIRQSLPPQMQEAYHYMRLRELRLNLEDEVDNQKWYAMLKTKKFPFHEHPEGFPNEFIETYEMGRRDIINNFRWEHDAKVRAILFLHDYLHGLHVCMQRGKEKMEEDERRAKANL